MGLMVTSAPIRAVMPKTTNRKPPALAMYTGMKGYPTTLSFVLPGPGYWVCLCTATSTMWAVNSPMMTAGSSST